MKKETFKWYFVGDGWKRHAFKEGSFFAICSISGRMVLGSSEQDQKCKTCLKIKEKYDKKNT